MSGASEPRDADALSGVRPPSDPPPAAAPGSPARGPAHAAQEPSEKGAAAPLSRLSSAVAWTSTLLVLGGLTVILVTAEPPRMRQTVSPPNTLVAVRVAGPRLLSVEPGSAFEQKLTIRTVQREATAVATLEVTGSVLASLREGTAPAETRWQFASPELLAAYVEWVKSAADIAQTRQQLGTTLALNETRTSAQTKTVERLRKLVEAGSDAPKDLQLEETALMQTKLEGQKQVHEAQMAVRAADRSQAALARQLEQAGLDAALLRSTKEGSAVLVADVPESKIDRAVEGQGCSARFYGLPGVVFRGRVGRISPTVTREQRTLRALVVLADAEGRLRPGMFADVGLGTDARDAIYVPSDAVLHVGRADYVLVQGPAPGAWVVTEVKLGERRGTDAEAVAGLGAGARVVAEGAILLKPFVVDALAKGTP